MDETNGTNGSETPDSGIFSPDIASRRSSVSSTDQSNGIQERRSSIDSGIGGFTSNSRRDEKNELFSTPLDSQKLTSALTGNSTLTQEAMPNITEGLESTNLTSGPNTLRVGKKTSVSESNSRSSRQRTAQSIQVYATGPGNKTIPLNINTSDSVEALIRLASSTLGFGAGSSYNTYLVFEGKTLSRESGLTVEKAGIKNGSQMQLCTRVVGG